MWFFFFLFQGLDFLFLNYVLKSHTHKVQCHANKTVGCACHSLINYTNVTRRCPLLTCSHSASSTSSANTTSGKQPAAVKELPVPPASNSENKTREYVLVPQSFGLIMFDAMTLGSTSGKETWWLTVGNNFLITEGAEVYRPCSSYIWSLRCFVYIMPLFCTYLF